MGVIKYKNPEYVEGGDKPKYLPLNIPYYSSDVYVGEAYPNEGYKIWINPNTGIFKYKKGSVWSDIIPVGTEDLITYGVEWNIKQSAPTCVRIGNPLLHKSLPIQSAYRGCVAKGKEIQYYLDPNDWSKKENGEDSILDGSDGDVRVHIPRFYGKSEVDGDMRRVKISLYKIDETWQEIPEMLVAAYRDTTDTTDSSNIKARSVVNTTTAFRGGNNSSVYDGYLETEPFRTMLGKPRTAMTRSTFRTYCKNAGSEPLCYEFYKWIFYWAYVIEYANFNAQAAYNADLTAEGYHQGGLGPGVTELNSANWSAYNSFCPLIPCGFCNSIGNFTGVINQDVSTEVITNLTTSMPSYSKDTAGGTTTNSGTSVIISKIAKANNRIVYCAWNIQAGTTVYNISGLNSGQSIIFYTNKAVVATATEDGEITVNWGNSQAERQIRASIVENECSITLSIVSASQETVTLSLGTLKIPRWRGFDNPFGDIWTILDGVVILNHSSTDTHSSVYTTGKYEGILTDNTYDKTLAGKQINSSGYIKEFDLGEHGEIIPFAVGGGATTYKCDYAYSTNGVSARLLIVGGNALYGAAAGPGSFYSNYGVGYSRSGYGFRSLVRM